MHCCRSGGGDCTKTDARPSCLRLDTDLYELGFDSVIVSVHRVVQPKIVIILDSLLAAQTGLRHDTDLYELGFQNNYDLLG